MILNFKENIISSAIKTNCFECLI